MKLQDATVQYLISALFLLLGVLYFVKNDAPVGIVFVVLGICFSGVISQKRKK